MQCNGTERSHRHLEDEIGGIGIRDVVLSMFTEYFSIDVHHRTCCA